MNILVSGGTIFVSKYISEYFRDLNYNVYIFNRGNNLQPEGVTSIKADRNNLGDIFKNYSFDVVIDANGYTKDDVKNLHEALGEFGVYIFISSSAVYPECLKQPFNEDDNISYNSYWKDYGLNKIEAEEYIKNNIKNHYIIRPPYLYGPMNNIYREAFVFDCAINDLSFYIPNDGKMKLQFFYIKDLCRFIEKLIINKPNNRIYNVGNKEIVDINKWVNLCYEVLNKKPNIINVYEDIDQKKYFPFLNYSYVLDIKRQEELLDDLTPLLDGLKESYDWYIKNKEKVKRKLLIEYITDNLK